ncbi:diguanylate cyclase [Ideonella sp. 4Y16]|uniref:diguanylate cyclase n=1 Tax=Ideonella aquatica TaxID=2824119 RepID=A0A940YM04_9BURK|nr:MULTISPECIES: diguanylate cyclase [Ideonella]MBQ0946165.1 diguanylate cyclase [Ideonella alba]MBQ0960411.1 diguanylate cyclase [Ideonella aquatica]
MTEMLRVMVAEDDAHARAHVEQLLGELRPEWSVCASVEDVASALSAAREMRPELLLLDIHLSDDAPEDWFKALLAEGRDVVFMTGDPGFAVHAFEGNAVDYLLKPITRPRLEAALGKLEARRAQRRQDGAIRALRAELAVRAREAREDVLTGLPNRREYDEFLEAEVLRALRYQRPLSLLAIDLDRFKQINDQGSHLLGDQVLQEVAKVLRTAVRQHDLVARLGGDEFAVVLPDTGAEGAMALKRLVEERMRAWHWSDEVRRIAPPTLSMGWGTLDLQALAATEAAEHLCAQADERLYADKAQRQIQTANGMR